MTLTYLARERQQKIECKFFAGAKSFREAGRMKRTGPFDPVVPF